MAYKQKCWTGYVAKGTKKSPSRKKPQAVKLSE